MMLRACSRCGKVHAYGARCNVNYSAEKTDDTKLRSSKRWKRKSLEVRNRQLFCQICLDKEHIYNYKKIEVHHIRKLRDDPNGLLDDKNLIALCRYHHVQADLGKFPEWYLTELVARSESTPPPQKA